MSLASQVIISRLREQMQALPAHSAVASEYETWARMFAKILVAFDRYSKGQRDTTVEELVKEATKILEPVADDSWVLWAGRLIPNVTRRVREEVEARAREERAEKARREEEAKEERARAEAERAAQEEAERVARRGKRLQEKLDAFLEGKITDVDLDKDSEEEEEETEAGRSEALGTEDVEGIGGTQSSLMDVDGGDDFEVVAVEDGRHRGRKRAPLSPPKASRKRARVATAMQTPVGNQAKGGSMQGSQVKTGGAASVGVSCERCVRQGIVCVATSGGARCANCKVKHYRCSLVPAKEVKGGKGGPSVLQQTHGATGSQTLGSQTRSQAQVKVFSALGNITSDIARREIKKRIRAAHAVGTLFRTRGGIRRSIDTLHWRIESHDTEIGVILRERDACEEGLRQLEEALDAQMSTDEEEMVQEQAEDKARRTRGLRQRDWAVEEDEDEDEDELEEEDEDEDEDEDELLGSFGLSAKARGKRPAR